MKHLLAAAAALAAISVSLAAPARAAEATFERDLTVSGRVDLSVATGSGNVHLTVGPAGHVHVFGRVKSGWGGSDEQVREIAANPPIEQTGNIVRIKSPREHFNNIGIDYEIQAPADSYLDAASGSGNVTDDGVGINAKLSTGSGNIRATGLQGGFSAGTGSGNIDAQQSGSGDVKASTGSGSIDLTNLHGGLRADTGSGNIKAQGIPAAPWHISTGSGSVEIWTGNASFTLDAGTGSGGVHCDREILSHGSEEHHHLRGDVGGGGPLVHIGTGSGSIRVH
ncbi:MAG: DUF4097 family beta strand repeat-containing protein [Terracidiphilus sp.]